MFQKSYPSNLTHSTDVWCFAYSFLEHVNPQAHLYHRPQNGHCLPTSDKWKNKWLLAGNSGPSQRRAVALLCYSSKRFTGIRAKPLSAMSSEGMTSLMYRSEEEHFKILIEFQGIFSLSVDLGGPSALRIDIWTVLSVLSVLSLKLR